MKAQFLSWLLNAIQRGPDPFGNVDDIEELPIEPEVGLGDSAILVTYRGHLYLVRVEERGRVVQSAPEIADVLVATGQG